MGGPLRTSGNGDVQGAGGSAGEGQDKVVVRLVVAEGEDWRGFVEECAAELLGWVPRLGKGARGKPCFEPECGLHFNVSTTRGRMAVAFARCEVGLDWEWGGRRCCGVALARRYFQEEERGWVEEGQDEVEQRRRFLWLWTSKEAGLKLDGRGIYTGGLRALRVGTPADAEEGAGFLEGRRMCFRRVAAGCGEGGEFFLTVACWGRFELALPQGGLVC